ncbi:hypothetical protein BBD42_17715 [Paenibacillus sp. BIHB 4019]|uniref:Xylose isomerase-like TIM barrel domain-containing protein n=1 Tax=Paenibacillus sp. BIHB 4019 TaxID=1870819 RepID=A0A1B2DK80_9BACL|nr:sugar phosphate isomerase/epimerase family protein [Paenibacillus sp. BIHB 4019]ANY68109.1 hypothetical protein BBD42_17715 [Paenibacillus sp. BIHB 4019]
MKFAFNSFSCPDLTLSQLIEVAKTYHYDGVELRAGVGHAHGAEVGATAQQREHMRRLAADSGIRICCLGVTNKFSLPQQAAEQLETAKANIRLASDLGIPVIRVAGGKIPLGASRDDTRITIAHALKELAPYARNYGVTIGVETHDDWSAPSDLASLLENVDDPQITAVWDVLHTKRRGFAEPMEVLQHLGAAIQHVHFHDAMLSLEMDKQLKPIGEGELDFLQIAHVLLEANYEGFVSGEWANWDVPYDIHLPQELIALKQYIDRARDDRQARRTQPIF